jgi:murein tripeptide amidase MpaA
MMKGIIEFFETYQTNKDAKAFLKNFVLVLIPMLNPDGVYRGHYRLDALGYDPNRY